MTTPYQLFYGQIPVILRDGPKKHREIALQLKNRFPEHCNDSLFCPHEGKKSSQPEWNHLARTAEQNLRKKGIIKYDYQTRKWGKI
jgi:hypothetical protein